MLENKDCLDVRPKICKSVCHYSALNIRGVILENRVSIFLASNHKFLQRQHLFSLQLRKGTVKGAIEMDNEFDDLISD